MRMRMGMGMCGVKEESHYICVVGETVEDAADWGSFEEKHGGSKYPPVHALVELSAGSAACTP